MLAYYNNENNNNNNNVTSWQFTFRKHECWTGYISDSKPMGAQLFANLLSLLRNQYTNVSYSWGGAVVFPWGFLYLLMMLDIFFPGNWHL